MPAQPIPAPSTDSLFFIRPEGIYRCGRPQFLGTQDAVLQGVADSVGLGLFHVCDMEDSHARLHLHLSTSATTLAIEMADLPLVTHYAPTTDTDGSVVMVPVFVPERGRAVVEASPSWAPPPTMRLFLLVACERQPNGRLAPHNAFLAAQDRATTRLYLLPLPNLHDHGMVCMGYEFQFPRTGDVKRMAQTTLSAFRANRWNADLLNADRRRRCHSLFRFDPEFKSLPFEGDWTALCKPFTDVAGNFLPTLFPAETIAAVRPAVPIAA